MGQLLKSDDDVMRGGPKLDWYPKPFGAGDMDGAGTQRLLGQPDLDLATLMVREMAQNSWDARLDGAVPQFEMRRRELSDLQRQHLTEQVFTETAKGSALQRLLVRNTPIEVFEVADRNTRGLGGTLRIDVDQDGPRNWVNFVLAVGAPPTDNSAAGGTYGFGKTASYAASRCSTIIIWTVTRHQGELQHRFIASSIDDGFSRDGQRFTGRQWWGMIDHSDPHSPRIEPLVGEEARVLGEALFDRQFTAGETGTSILILEPLRLSDEEMSWADRLPMAAVRNLWPKLLADQEEGRCMNISMYDMGRELPLITEEQSPTLEALGRCLKAVRSANMGEPIPEDPFMRVVEIRLKSPKLLSGHAAFTRYMPAESDPLGGLSGKVTLMRSPELVVKEESISVQGVGPTAWVGVFKPLDKHDRAFAFSEPPAHDTWAPANMRNRDHKRLVNVSLRELREQIRMFVKPAAVDDQARGSQPTAALAAQLASLTGTALGSRPTSGSRGANTAEIRGRGVASAQSPAQVRISGIVPLPHSDEDIRSGRERSRIDFHLDHISSSVHVVPASMKIAIDGSKIDADDQIRVEHGIDTLQNHHHDLYSMHFNEPSTGALVVSYPIGMAIDVTLKAEA